jgi:hypothetical protein
LALVRSRCFDIRLGTGDFTTIDHLALVERPLAEVRERFGVPALE